MRMHTHTHAHMCLHTQTTLRTGSAWPLGTWGIFGGFFCFPGQWLYLVGMASLVGDWNTPPPPHQ